MQQKEEGNLQHSLYEWAERVVGVYNPIAKKEGVNYYTQSNLSLLHSAPELLLLGINPGSAGGDGKELTAKEFLQGNPEYHTKGSWTMWQRLCRLFAQGNMLEMLQDEGSLVWSNVFHLNSKKESGLTNPMKAPELVQLTRDLIQILQPQRVLCLGGANCLYQLFPKYETTLEALIPGVLWYTRIGSTPVYGIPHTSSCYTNEQTDLLGKVLAFLFNASEADHTAEAIEFKFPLELRAYRERLKGSSAKVFLLEVGRIVKEEVALASSDDKNLIYLNDYLQVRIAETKDCSLNISYRSGYNKSCPFKDEVVACLEQREAWDKRKYVPFRNPGAPANIRCLRLDPDLKTYISKENGAYELAQLIRQELESLADALGEIFKD